MLIKPYKILISERSFPVFIGEISKIAKENFNGDFNFLLDNCEYSSGIFNDFFNNSISQAPILQCVFGYPYPSLRINCIQRYFEDETRKKVIGITLEFGEIFNGKGIRIDGFEIDSWIKNDGDALNPGFHAYTYIFTGGSIVNGLEWDQIFGYFKNFFAKLNGPKEISKTNHHCKKCGLKTFYLNL